MRQLKNVLIVANRRKANLDNIVKIVQAELLKRAISSYVVSPAYFTLDNKELITDFDDQYRYEEYDLILAIGGDGTFLYTARTFLNFNIPMAGINIGRLGFLMEVGPDETGRAVDGIINGTIALKKRTLLDAHLARDGKEAYSFPFLNDAVISKGVLSRMVEMKVSLDDEPLSQYRADGLIVSTPTGSTAYNLAAGGPILTPDMEAMIITPICPHTLGVRPIVTCGERTLHITVISGEADASLTIDGQENFFLKKGDRITIKSSGRQIQVYEYGGGQFFKVLSEKLGWK